VNEVRIPKPGDAITEAVLAKILVADGETVVEGDPLYELETEKVEMVIDAPWSGVVSWKVEVGETYPVGTLIATITA
jgi:pyruvate/2-oxoglutarate dehydrogenase complex dihydrolipoamide acyltransferase (E2) component